MTIKAVNPNVSQALLEVEVRINDLNTDLDQIDPTASGWLLTTYQIEDQIKDMIRVRDHLHADDDAIVTVGRINQLMRTIGRLVPDDNNKQGRIDHLNRVRSILLTNDDGSGGSDPVVAINQEIKKMLTDKYIGAIVARIEGLNQDLDIIEPNSYDDWAIQTRIADLSVLHSDIIRRDNPDRAEALIDQRISSIEEYNQLDERLARQRIADLSRLKDVLTGREDL